MKKIVNISGARAAKEKAALAFREEIIAFSEQKQFPGGQIIDQGTQEPTLDEEAENELQRMSKFFGVTELNPLDPDFDLVCNTWYELGRVSSSLKSRLMFETTLYAARLRIWHPTYKAYVDALWDGRVADIAACAKALNIHRGIPESASRLREGPIQLPTPA